MCVSVYIEVNEGNLRTMRLYSQFLHESVVSSYYVPSNHSSYRKNGMPFITDIFCDALAYAIQYRLVNVVYSLLDHKIMNNSIIYECFDKYYNVLNQTMFHLVTKSRTAGFVRIFFHYPFSKHVLFNLEILTNGLDMYFNRTEKYGFDLIIKQNMIRDRIRDIDIYFILNAAFKVNLPLTWYYKRDIYGKTAFDLWYNHAPYKNKHLWWYMVSNQLLYTLNYDIKEMQYLVKYNYTQTRCLSFDLLYNTYNKVNGFLTFIPDYQAFIEPPTHINTSVTKVASLRKYNEIFKYHFDNDIPLIYKGGITKGWNLKDINIKDIKKLIKKKHKFQVTNIPYQNIYYFPNKTQNKKVFVTFNKYLNKYFNDTINKDQSTFDDVCKIINARDKANKDDYLPLKKPYIFDTKLYEFNKTSKFVKRFPVYQLIPEYILERMDIFNDYVKTILPNQNIPNEVMLDNIILLKQLSIGGIFTGSQPHWHGSVINGLIYGKKKWIIWPKKETFQVKKTSIEFFCEFYENDYYKQNFYTFIQNIGDIVYIPKEWGHAVLNMEPSIGVAIELYT